MPESAEKPDSGKSCSAETNATTTDYVHVAAALGVSLQTLKSELGSRGLKLQRWSQSAVTGEKP